MPETLPIIVYYNSSFDKIVNHFGIWNDYMDFLKLHITI